MLSVPLPPVSSFSHVNVQFLVFFSPLSCAQWLSQQGLFTAELEESLCQPPWHEARPHFRPGWLEGTIMQMYVQRGQAGGGYKRDLYVEGEPGSTDVCTHLQRCCATP